MTSMAGFPSLPSVSTGGSAENDTANAGRADLDDVFREGHLWTEELIDGDPLRFRMTDAGFLEFGDDGRVLDHDAAPLRYRAAVRAVRGGFARDAFAAAVDHPSTITFFGVATHTRRIPYDLDRIPPFLGTALYDADRERYLPPDTAHQAFERVGLPTIDPIEKELRAAHVDPFEYPIPDSRWYDGPAAGVVFHNKSGGRAVRRGPDPDPLDASSDADSAGVPESTREFLDDRVDDIDIDRAIAARGGADQPTVEAVVGRVIERLARETRWVADERTGSDELRSVLADRVDRYLREST